MGINANYHAVSDKDVVRSPLFGNVNYPQYWPRFGGAFLWARLTTACAHKAATHLIALHEAATDPKQTLTKDLSAPSVWPNWVIYVDLEIGIISTKTITRGWNENRGR